MKITFASVANVLRVRSWLVVAFLGIVIAPVGAQQGPVTVPVEIVRGSAGKPSAAKNAGDASNVVVWLVPLDGAARPALATQQKGPTPQLVQRNKTFEPHLLVVQAGTMVEFPNKDPYFHNVFSLFDGKRFDLGLYEAGTSRAVHFDRPGVSYLFCNIHPEMSAVVIAVETPYFGVSDRSGHVSIRDVPDGRYRMRVWYERGQADELKNLDRVVTISASARSLDVVRIDENADFKLEHKNKYGQDYEPPVNATY